MNPLQAHAEACIRFHGVPGAEDQPSGLFDTWRSQFIPASDDVELFTAWTDAVQSLGKKQDGALELYLITLTGPEREVVKWALTGLIKDYRPVFLDKDLPLLSAALYKLDTAAESEAAP